MLEMRRTGRRRVASEGDEHERPERTVRVTEALMVAMTPSAAPAKWRPYSRMSALKCVMLSCASSSQS